ncbi:hypothetical protein [Propionibacterium australiense]|uniref:Uncharacterized protein n=1 Tax=Propionibacterium australiense TaxID=119981 RepID=A0A383S3L5_9ACTN|nr:hypothetical protein [Propionibacterium australiense]RLP12585.1 hypothetical protein D9T14_01710 [Propionibacterium australiense]SYZ32590.1 Hypothetical protein PROPAUS_0476 [Propionibacterium australiense]VEH91659.1 Uncharacterised protein [Propionibacterium australiense]
MRLRHSPFTNPSAMLRRRLQKMLVIALASLLALLVVLAVTVTGAIAGLFSPTRDEPSAIHPTGPSQSPDDSVAEPEFVRWAIDQSLATDPAFQPTRIVMTTDEFTIAGTSGSDGVRHSYRLPGREATSTTDRDVALAALDRDGIDLDRLQSVWTGARCEHDSPQVQVTAARSGATAYSVLCPAGPGGDYALTRAWLGDEELRLPESFSSSESVTRALTETLPALTGDAPLSQVIVRQDQNDPSKEVLQVSQPADEPGRGVFTTHLQARGAANPAVLTVPDENVKVTGRFTWDDVDPQVLARIADACREDPAVNLYQGLQVHWSDDYWQLVVTTNSNPSRTYTLDGILLG